MVMPFFTAVVTVFVTPLSYAANSVQTCYQAEQMAYDQTASTFQRGGASRMQLAHATIDLLDARFECGDLPLKAYCAQARLALPELTAGVNAEPARGISRFLKPAHLLGESQRIVRAVEKSCSGVPN